MTRSYSIAKIIIIFNVTELSNYATWNNKHLFYKTLFLVEAKSPF